MEPENMRGILTVDKPVNLGLGLSEKGNSIDNRDGVISNPPREPITTALKSNTLLSASDSSPSLPKRGRGRPPKTNTSNNPNPKSSLNTTGGGGVQDRSDEVVKRGRGRPPRSIAKPNAIPKPIVGGSSPRKVITDASDSGTAGGDSVPEMVILPPDEKNIKGDVPTVISTTASGRPVRCQMNKNVESFAVAPVVNGAVAKPVSSGKPVGRPRKVGAVGRPRRAGAVGRPAEIGGGVVKKTAGRPRKVGNNLKERVVMLLEESLGYGMNQNAPDMYLRFIQLYTIITGKEYNIALAGATAPGNNQ